MFGLMTLLQRLSDVGLVRRRAPSTIRCYRSWVMEFLRFCRIDRRWRHPRELGAHDVDAFLTHLVRDRRVSASTQNQALNAIVFLYKQVQTTMIYTHVMNEPAVAVSGPLDHLDRLGAGRLGTMPLDRLLSIGAHASAPLADEKAGASPSAKNAIYERSQSKPRQDRVFESRPGFLGSAVHKN
jgi:hypothetical protein